MAEHSHREHGAGGGGAGLWVLREEQDMAAQFGHEYREYAVKTPRFLPKLGVHPVPQP